MSLSKNIVGRAYITANQAHNRNPALPVITGKIRFDDGDEYWIDFWQSRNGEPNVFTGNILVPPVKKETT
jgi:hypothetical protein